MRRGLFGLIGAAAVVATAAVGCSTGGGSAEDYDLPDIPGDTVKAMEFTLDAYGPTDKAMLMIVNAGKNEKTVYGQDIAVKVNYKTPTTDTGEKVSFKRATARKDVTATATETSDFSVDYLCGFGESVEKFDALVRPNADPDPSVSDPVTPHWDGKDVGTTAKMFPPSAVSSTFSSDNMITVMKVLSDDESSKCNILAQCNASTEAIVPTEVCKQIATVFGVGSSSVYSVVTKNLGNEWKYSPAGGLDGDSRVNIVICDSSVMNGHLAAVRFCDCFKKKSVYNSNEGEYIYLSTELLKDSSGEWLSGVSQLLTGELAHQLAHLILTNNKVIQEGAFTDFRLGESSARKSVETASLSEGYAHLAADLCGAGVSGAQNSAKGADIYALDDINMYLGNDSYFEERDSSYSVSFPQSLFSREQGNFSQQFYGGSHMFMLYLLKNFGLTTISEMAQSTATGTANLTKYTDEDAAQIFSKYCRSVFLSQYADLPEADAFSYIKVNSANYVNSDQEIYLTTLPPYAALYTRKVEKGEESAYMAPWTAQLIGFKGGEETGKSLIVDVEYPTLGNVYMWRMNNDGSYSKEVVGVEKQIERGR